MFSPHLTRFSFTSIRVRLVLLSLMGIVPLSALVLYNGLGYRQDEARHTRETTQRVARLATARQESLIEAAQHLLVGLAQPPPVCGPDPTSCSTTFGILLTQYPRYLNIGAADAHGNIFAIGRPMSRAANAARSTWFQRAVQSRGLAIGEYGSVEVTDKYALVLGYPAFDSAGNLKLVFFAALDLSWINQFAADAELSAGSVVGLVSSDGTGLAASLDAEKWLGRTVSNTALFRADQHSDVGEADIEGVRRVYSFTHLPTGGDQTEAYVFVGIPTAEAYGHLNSEFKQSLVLLIGVSALALAATWLFGQRSLLRPVKALLSASERLSGGDLNARTGLTRSPDELKRLATTFDVMAESLAQQITELGDAHRTVTETESRLRTIIESEPECVKLLDAEARLLDMNPAGLHMIEADSLSQVKGQAICSLVAPEYRDDFMALTEKAFQGGTGTLEFEIVGLKGTHRWLETHTVPLRDSSGAITAAMGISRDITERRRAEEGLHLLRTIALSVGQAEDLDSALAVVLRTLCEATGWILGQAWTPNRDGTILECSSAWHSGGPGLEDFRALSEGLTFGPGIGLPGRVWTSKRHAWVSDVTVDLNFPRASSARKAGLKAAVGIPVLAGDEVILVIEFFVRQLRKEDERLVDLISAVAVEVGLVFQRKRAEEAVVQSEKKFSAIFQTIPDPVSIMRIRDGFMLDLNDAWAAQTGYLKSERIGKTAQEMNLLPKDEVRERLMASLLEGGELNNYEAQFRMKDGSLRYGLTSARVIELDGEQCAVSITRDITDLKAAEEATRQSEAKFRTLAETTPSAIVVYRFEDAKIQYVNAAMEKISGYSQAELLELTIWDLIHPDSVEIVTQRRLARLKGERVSPRTELKLVTKSGEDCWVDQSIGTIEFEGEAAMLVTAFDVTDRKRAEEALRRSEERYRLIVENQTEFIVKWLPDGTRTFVNESYCRYFGIGEEDCLGTSFFPLVAQEFREAIHRKPASLTPDAPAYTEEHISIVPGGQCWQQWSNRGIFNAEGNLIELLSTGRDITERKTAEEALQESEALGRRLNERFSLAVESAGIGVWDLDLVNNKLTWDQQMYLLHQIAPEEFSGAYEAWARDVHPDDLPRMDAEVQEAIKGVKPFDTDFRVIWPDGEARHIKAFARVVRDDVGAPIRMTGINYDITARRRAEEALKQSETNYRALVENTPDIIARLDRDCRYLFVNSAVAQVSKTKPEDFVGRSLREGAFSDEQASFREEVIRNVFETLKPFETESELEGANGRGIFEWRVYPEFDERGNIQTVLSINRDVTKRRQAEEQLKQSREQLRALSSHLQSVREEERTHIAREVHDELGQALTALKIDLYALQRDLTRDDNPGAARQTEKMRTMSSLIDTTIHSVRRIATELRPGILDDLGLVAAIEWQANDFQTRTGIHCEVAASVEYLELDRDRSTAAFRILQETLTNVARHAGASTVDIELKQDDGHLVLEVKDNGKGITASDISASKSLGLLGMRERAQLLGGDLKISGAAGDGTRVTVSIPL